MALSLASWAYTVSYYVDDAGNVHATDTPDDSHEWEEWEAPQGQEGTTEEKDKDYTSGEGEEPPEEPEAPEEEEEDLEEKLKDKARERKKMRWEIAKELFGKVEEVRDPFTGLFNAIRDALIMRGTIPDVKPYDPGTREHKLSEEIKEIQEEINRAREGNKK